MSFLSKVKSALISAWVWLFLRWHSLKPKVRAYLVATSAAFAADVLIRVAAIAVHHPIRGYTSNVLPIYLLFFAMYVLWSRAEDRAESAEKLLVYYHTAPASPIETPKQ